MSLHAEEFRFCTGNRVMQGTWSVWEALVLLQLQSVDDKWHMVSDINKHTFRLVHLSAAEREAFENSKRFYDRLETETLHAYRWENLKTWLLEAAGLALLPHLFKLVLDKTIQEDFAGGGRPKFINPSSRRFQRRWLSKLRCNWGVVFVSNHQMAGHFLINVEGLL